MKKVLLLSVLIVSLLNCFAQVNTKDSMALVQFYKSTGGKNWTNHTNWLTKAPVSTWYGIGVGNVGGESRVVNIIFDFQGNNLVGSIPSSFGNLTQLTTFEFSGNSLLIGSLPPSFKKLINLTEIFMFNCGLSGSLKVLESIPHPFDFEFSNNHFSGALPNLQNTPGLVELDLDFNQFTGTIPESYGYMNSTGGGVLYLNDNQLTGKIPQSFGIEYQQRGMLVNLSNNLLSGAIPANLVNSDPSKVDLSIGSNHFNFDSLEYILFPNGPAIFSYSPQANIPITYSPFNTFGKLSVSAGGTLTNNIYSWVRNNKLYKNIVGDSTFSVDSAGTYYVYVNNLIAKSLTLFSDSIVVTAACSAAPSGMAVSNIQQTSVTLNWNAAQGATQYQVQHKLSGAASFSTTTNVHTSFTLRNLTAGQTYVWRVRSQCPLGYSVYSAIDTFKTATGLQHKMIAANEFSVYPNPATSTVNINFSAPVSAVYELSVYDLEGKRLLSKNVTAAMGTNNPAIDIHSLPAGIYLLKLRSNNVDVMVEKIVKE
jgi:hypothetical protein